MPPRPPRLTLPSLGLLFVLAAPTACAGPPGRLVDLYGSVAAYRLVSAPTPDAEVTAYRVLPPHLAGEVSAPPGAIEIHGNQVLAGPVPVDTRTRDLLSDVLGDDDTFDWDRAKGCEFTPGVAIRWTQGELTVDTLLCFSCDEVGVYRNGKWVALEDFDRRRADLVTAVQRLFPDDDQLQALRR